MKKIYTNLCVLILLCVTFFQSQAQSCATARVYPYKYKNQNKCFVFVSGGIAGANIHVYSNGTRINVSENSTDNWGDGTVFFDCSSTVTAVILTKPDGSVCSLTGTKIADVGEISTLPIILSSFKAEVKNSTANLQWVSSTELRSDEYQIQRSTDGKNFTTIGSVKSKGNSVEFVKYTFADAQLGSSAAYYRLKMVDIDGTFEYSKVVYVNNKNGVATSLSVFPNPFRSDVQLVGVAAADVNKQNIRIYDVAGKQINFSVSGSNAITVDPTTPRGIYILRIKEQTFKLVKE